MKTVFYIILLTLIFSLNIFSQEKAQAIVLPENFSSEPLQNIYQSDLDFLGEFKIIDSRTNINKTILGNGFILIEVLFQSWDGSAWMISGKSSYIYDVNNNLIERLSQTWDGSAWVNSFKSSYTYNVNNNLIERLSKHWDGSAWVNFEKYSYTYEGNNNWTEILLQVWDNSSWENRGKYLYTYNVNNYLVEQLYQTWDGSNWLDKYKIIYIYDASNNLTETLWKLWNGSVWLISGKDSYTYDGNNNQIEILSQRWDGSAWVNVSKSSYTYDGNNNLAELLFQMWNVSAWANVSKYLFTYAPITAVNVNFSSVNSYSLSNNYPNPFNPSTKISYTIPERSNVTLVVFDLLGSEVAALVNGEIEPGTYDITFNASQLSSGIYFYRFQGGDFVQTRKMIVIK